MKKILKWGGIAFVVLIIIGVIAGSGGDSSSSTSSNSGSSQQSSTSKEAVNTVHSMGEDVTVGEVRWKLIDAQDLGTTLKASQSRYSGIAKDKTDNGGGKFIQVTVEVENLGKEMKSVSNLKLIDDQGREFTSSSDTSEWVPEGKELFLLSTKLKKQLRSLLKLLQIKNS